MTDKKISVELAEKIGLRLADVVGDLLEHYGVRFGVRAAVAYTIGATLDVDFTEQPDAVMWQDAHGALWLVWPDNTVSLVKSGRKGERIPRDVLEQDFGPLRRYEP